MPPTVGLPPCGRATSLSDPRASLPSLQRARLREALLSRRPTRRRSIAGRRDQPFALAYAYRNAPNRLLQQGLGGRQQLGVDDSCFRPTGGRERREVSVEDRERYRALRSRVASK